MPESLPTPSGSLTTLNCDECGAIVGVWGMFAFGCTRHPNANYAPSHTYIEVDHLVEFLDEPGKPWGPYPAAAARVREEWGR